MQRDAHRRCPDGGVANLMHQYCVKPAKFRSYWAKATLESIYIKRVCDQVAVPLNISEERWLFARDRSKRKPNLGIAPDGGKPNLPADW